MCVNNMRCVPEYNPHRQMSGLSDGSDAQSYKHGDILPERGVTKISDNMAERAFYRLAGKQHQCDSETAKYSFKVHASVSDEKNKKKDSFGCRGSVNSLESHSS